MRFTRTCLALCAAFGFTGWLAAQAPQAGDGPEVLARGPVHEGFAEAIDAQPQPGPVLAKQPPAAIEELPPDQKPAGDNVVWLPGYWSWDEDRSDFLWVSGFWRVPPPNRTWVPGSWRTVNGQWQWTGRFWAEAAQPEVTYLPQPPTP